MVIVEPSHRFFQRDFRWRLRKTQFPNRFGAVVVHLVFGHFDAFKGNAGRSTRQIGDPMIGIGKGQNSHPRQFDAGRRTPVSRLRISNTSRSIRFLLPRI